KMTGCWAAPVIVSGPPSLVVAGVGGSAAITVGFLSNSDTPLSLPLPQGYQVSWSHDGAVVGGGATTLTTTGPNTYTATLHLSNVSAADGGLYRCTISSPCGAGTSSTARLRVIRVP